MKIDLQVFVEGFCWRTSVGRIVDREETCCKVSRPEWLTAVALPPLTMVGGGTTHLAGAKVINIEAVSARQYIDEIARSMSGN